MYINRLLNEATEFFDGYYRCVWLLLVRHTYEAHMSVVFISIQAYKEEFLVFVQCHVEKLWCLCI